MVTLAKFWNLVAPVHQEQTGFKVLMEQHVVATMDAAGTTAELKFHQKENVYKALRLQHGHMTTKINFGFSYKVA